MSGGQNKWYRKPHWQILCGILLGTGFGILCILLQWRDFALNWVSPFGDLFINFLRLIAVPLVLTSIISGIASLRNLQKLSRIGFRALGLYILTTCIAVAIGLGLVHLIKPGSHLPEQARAQLAADADFQAPGGKDGEHAESHKVRKFISALVPTNLFQSLTDNRNLLQIVILSVFFGVCLILIPAEKAAPTLTLVHSLNEAFIKFIELLMKAAPVGVFALMATAVISLGGDDPGQFLSLLRGIGIYGFIVVLGLAMQVGVTYSLMLTFLAKRKMKEFLTGIFPAQLVAFSTSSSAATLPVTLKQCEQELKVKEEVASFVLPLGTTINMDGTALYQAVATVFLAQALDIGIGLGGQLTILLMTLLASIGSAAVPSAGLIMLAIILESVGIPAGAIVLILGLDRILDMLRTVVNVTGDCMVACIINHSERSRDCQTGARDTVS